MTELLFEPCFEFGGPGGWAGAGLGLGWGWAGGKALETNRWVGRKSGDGSVGRAAGLGWWAGLGRAGLGWAGLDGLGVVGWLWGGGGGWGLGLGWDTPDSVRYSAMLGLWLLLGLGWAGAGAGGRGYLIFESDSLRGSAWLDSLGWLGKGVGRACDWNLIF